MDGLLLGTAALLLVTAVAAGGRSAASWIGATSLAALAALASAVRVLAGGATWEWTSGFLLGGEAVHLRLDAVSAVFLALLAVAGGNAAVYAIGYWRDAEHKESAPRSRRWFAGILLSMGLVLLCSNGLHFLIAWEAFAICAYFLITLESGSKNVRDAGWLYLAASHAGTLVLFAFFGALASRTGSWELGPWHGRADLAPLYALALVGFGVKAGLFPLHIWLPSAHGQAPSHVSAIMSGVAIKMGVYGWVRFGGWLDVGESIGWALMGAGAVSAVVGIWFGLVQNDLKRLLAYCSVENIGIIAIGLGGALAGNARNAPWGALLLAGVLLHVWNHGVFKSLLFMGAGSALHATGTREMSRLGGLWRLMPWTSALFGLGSAAICALPPFNGLVGEWLIYLGLVSALREGGDAGWALVLAITALALSGALALAAFVKANAITWLGAPRSAAAEHAHECTWSMRVPMIVLALLCVLLGVAPMLAAPALVTAVGDWSASWPAASVPVARLGWANVIVAAAMVLGGALLLGRVKELGLRRGPTWDCGFAHPTRRMQYSSGSFSSIALEWLAGARLARGQRQRPKGLFPARASIVIEIPDAILERVCQPSAAAVLRLSAGARALQRGRLQFYIVYVMAAVALIAAIVWWSEVQ